MKFGEAGRTPFPTCRARGSAPSDPLRSHIVPPGGPSTVRITLAVLASLAGSPAALFSQSPGANGDRPSVFFDCAGRSCNFNYYRTEIPWVNWVRQPEDADVHLIMTSQATGAGGREYQLDFIGTGDSEYEDQLRYRAPLTGTDREALDGIAHTLSLGLLYFASASGFEQFAEIVEVARDGIDPGARVVTGTEVEDPWDFWVFSLNGGAEVEGEQTRRTQRVDGSFNASRVTPTWRLGFRGNMNFNRREVDLTEGEFVDQRTDWGVRQIVVYAVADHWSIGMQGEVSKATRFNQQFRTELTPAVEYSVFPYEQATRRALTAFYKVGPAHRRYIEPTVFGETAETRWEHAAEVELSQRQRWGDASIRLLGSHFLHDTDLYSVALRGYLDVRIARGLSLGAGGNISWVSDQIYLSAEGATDAEALLNLQQRSQDFNYEIEVGFSFQFGSVYNNVVNNRFDGGRGFYGF